MTPAIFWGRTVAALTLTLSSVLLLPAAWAQDKDPHAGHTMAASGDASPSSQAYEAANARMHKDMSVALSGDADRDFLAGMIPHHQGAIDMAEVVLKYGKDPKVKQLARNIIRAQKQEIAMMTAWLKAKEATK
jgi:uncharacterized protein (DUF305 family)